MIKAVIFDMDGVISDTQGSTAQLESELLSRYGIALSADEITATYAGVSDQEFFQEVFSKAGKTPDLPTLIAEKDRLLSAQAELGVSAVPGTIDCIQRLSAKQIPLGVASASSVAFIERVLAALGVRKYFLAVTSSEEVSRGKPDPAIFLLAAQKLGVEPHECVVIEDGMNGMKAARAAGMKCIGLVPDSGRVYPCDRTVASLAELSVEEIVSLA